MTFKCPKCGSTLFHVETNDNRTYILKCYRTKSCGWQKTLTA